MAKGRPPKDESLLQNQPLRIMLTVGQKALIERASQLEGLDMTQWARPILLEAAKARIAREETHKSRRK